MNAKDAMLCWNPGTDEVALVPWPDTTDLSGRYFGTALACYTNVQKKDFEQRKAQVFIDAMHLIIRDKCDPMAVHKTLLGLDEYRDGCSEDMPGAESFLHESN